MYIMSHQNYNFMFKMEDSQNDISSRGFIKRHLYQFFYWIVTFNFIPAALYYALQVHEIFQILVIVAHTDPEVAQSAEENVWYNTLEHFAVSRFLKERCRIGTNYSF